MKDISLEQLLEAGSHFGHQKRRWNPAMRDYVYGERDGVHIFDLVKTRDGLLAACEYAEKTAREGGKILFVGTKRQSGDIVKAEAIRVGMPYVTVRWMGGMLTNFSHLRQRVKRMVDLKSQRASGELKKYTKKERLLLDREIARLEKFFGGVVDLDKLPQAMFVVDTHKEDVAVSEAVRTKVTVLGMVDTNANPDKVDYVIPANDDAVKSIELVVGAIADAIAVGKDLPVVERKIETKVESDVDLESVVEEKETKVENKPEVKAKTARKKKEETK